jgi:hypothetical protein
MSRATVHKFARVEQFPERAQRLPQASILDPYLPYLQERWAAGCTNAHQLWREIHAQGYPGGVAAPMSRPQKSTHTVLHLHRVARQSTCG